MRTPKFVTSEFWKIKFVNLLRVHKCTLGGHQSYKRSFKIGAWAVPPKLLM